MVLIRTAVAPLSFSISESVVVITVGRSVEADEMERTGKTFVVTRNYSVMDSRMTSAKSIALTFDRTH